MQTERTGVDRINGFSDGVFAVAITLLILTIDVPEITGRFSERALLNALGDMWHNFFGFVLSFVIIGMFWMSHHQLFRLIRKYNAGLMWLNHFFLMCIVFLPFPTEMMSTYPDSRVATGIYAASMALCGLLACALWWYSTVRHDLVGGSLTPAQKKDPIYSFLAMSAVFLLSLAVLCASTSAAKYSWLAIWPIDMYLSRKYGKEDAAMEAKDREPDAPGEEG